MNMNVIETVIVFFLLSMGPSAFSQGGSSFKPETTLAAATTSTKKTAPATATSARFHKRFPQLFTGFAFRGLQLLRTNVGIARRIDDAGQRAAEEGIIRRLYEASLLITAGIVQECGSPQTSLFQ